MKICIICNDAPARSKYCKPCGIFVQKNKIKQYHISKRKDKKCADCGVIIISNATKRCNECGILNRKAQIKKYTDSIFKNDTKRYLYNKKKRELYKNNKDFRLKQNERSAKFNKENYVSRRKKAVKTADEYRQSRNKYAKKYYAEYYVKKPSQKIGLRFRQRIWRFLKGKSVKYKIEDVIGCSKEFLKNYLEGLFLDGMNWDNWNSNGWHIDHKNPCIAYNLENIEELKKCFHYTNLQPLWAKDNLKKGSKILY